MSILHSSAAMQYYTALQDQHQWAIMTRLLTCHLVLTSRPHQQC